ncbi:beta-ketoacyl-[acyl-carrier-protein] synthase family protein [Desulfosediminicola sp.]|uniref:beta-ketoacyl-[acyl-carrier-protein] synthase family protein n=1 Tax=Desulfosediminicola sp. TaxID=2886825 RepID=UPI003AF1E2D3
MSTSSVVISGTGCIAAVGNGCREAFAHLQQSKVRNVQVAEEYFTAPFTAPCFLVSTGRDGSGSMWQGLALKADNSSNRTIRLALTAIEEALLEAGVSLDRLAGKRVGIALGTTVGCTFHNERYYIDWKEQREPDSTALVTYLNANLAERIQRVLGVCGPRMVITNACASGTDAIGVAKSWLENDLCDIAIAGGVDELSRIACNGFRSLMLVADTSCTPFDKDRQGLNLGEGAGVFVLQREAEAAGNDPLGWVRGYGTAGDAHHPTAPHPQGEGLQRALALALKDAGCDPAGIALINAHGTGTLANDRAETNAISEMGFDAERTPVVSTKGATGHTLGAAGGIEAVFTLMALNAGKTNGTVGCSEQEADLAVRVLAQAETADLHGRIGISQSLAFGGSNSVLVIEGAGL